MKPTGGGWGFFVGAGWQASRRAHQEELPRGETGTNPTRQPRPGASSTRQGGRPVNRSREGPADGSGARSPGHTGVMGGRGGGCPGSDTLGPFPTHTRSRHGSNPRGHLELPGRAPAPTPAGIAGADGPGRAGAGRDAGHQPGHLLPPPGGPAPGGPGGASAGGPLPRLLPATRGAGAGHPVAEPIAAQARPARVEPGGLPRALPGVLVGRPPGQAA